MRYLTSESECRLKNKFNKLINGEIDDPEEDDTIDEVLVPYLIQINEIAGIVTIHSCDGKSTCSVHGYISLRFAEEKALAYYKNIHTFLTDNITIIPMGGIWFYKGKESVQIYFDRQCIDDCCQKIVDFLKEL